MLNRNRRLNSFFLLLVGVLPALTGGDTHYFPDFDKSRSGDLFAHDLRHSLEREQGSNGALRLRCSNGKLSKPFFDDQLIHWFLIRIGGEGSLWQLPYEQCDRS